MSRRAHLSFGDRAVALYFPAELHKHIEALFALSAKRPAGTTLGEPVLIARDDAERFVVASSRLRTVNLAFGDALNVALLEMHREVVAGFGTDAIVLHAAAVRLKANGQGVLIPGSSRTGKSTLAAWLIQNGADYLSDDVSAFYSSGELRGLYRPLALRADVWNLVSKFGFVTNSYALEDNRRLVQAPRPTESATAPCGLILVPDFEAGRAPSLTRISPAAMATEIMAGNYNAPSLADHGLSATLRLVRKVPALRLSYGSLEQLAPLKDRLAALTAGNVPVAEFDRLVAEANAALAAGPPPKYPPATPRKGPVKLTVGMATFNDYDGVYFTIQALRMYHPEVLHDAEILVIDNNPEGKAASHLKALENDIPNFRYVPFIDKGGSAVSKGRIFEEAEGRYVLGMDCHVLLWPGAVRRLLAYFDAHPDSSDLLQGPLVYDGLTAFSSHWDKVWRGGMWGTWAEDPRAKDIDGEPFEIPMQGMGLFAARREAWLGFNPEFRGFGGEEGYIQEKFRRAGHRTLCLPFLRWMHRFHRPEGVPYSNKWEDRIRNYIIGFRELGLPTDEIIPHFQEFLDPHTFGVVLKILEDEFGPLLPAKVDEPA